MQILNRTYFYYFYIELNMSLMTVILNLQYILQISIVQYIIEYMQI